jgi:cytochrome b subunit of formate dehydrogenase
LIETEKKRVTGRAFAYTSASLVTGVIIYMFTNSFLIYTERPDIIGTLVLAAFALVYLNVSFVLARRFTSKTRLFPLFPYLTGFLLVVPGVILSELTEKFLFPRSLVVLSVVLLAASLAGAWFGIRRGEVRYHENKKARKDPELSGDLKRPHNHISRN